MVNKHSSVAMYIQIAQTLKNEISQQLLKPGECIGTHAELAKRFNVSMITIRKAIESLTEAGVLIVRQGKGTFVNAAPLEDGSNKLTTMSAVLINHQMDPEVHVKEMRVIDTPDSFPRPVARELGETCLFIERTHMVKEIVIGYSKLYLPCSYGKKFSFEDVSTYSIYELYTKKLGITLGKGVQYIRASKADKPLASALSVPENTPLLVIERESYSKQGQLIEYMKSYYEYTQYSFKIELDLSVD